MSDYPDASRDVRDDDAESTSVSKSCKKVSRRTLDKIAESLNCSITEDRSPEPRSTQAVVQTEKGEYVMFTQREYNCFDDEIHAMDKKYRVWISERHIGDQSSGEEADEGIHAEMLAISFWLQGRINRPTAIGVSKSICPRCWEVLKYYGVERREQMEDNTPNWVHPSRHAGQEPPEGLSHLPQKVTKNREYDW